MTHLTLVPPETEDEAGHEVRGEQSPAPITSSPPLLVYLLAQALSFPGAELLDVKPRGPRALVAEVEVGSEVVRFQLDLFDRRRS